MLSLAGAWGYWSSWSASGVRAAKFHKQSAAPMPPWRPTIAAIHADNRCCYGSSPLSASLNGSGRSGRHFAPRTVPPTREDRNTTLCFLLLHITFTDADPNQFSQEGPFETFTTGRLTEYEPSCFSATLIFTNWILGYAIVQLWCATIFRDNGMEPAALHATGLSQGAIVSQILFPFMITTRLTNQPTDSDNDEGKGPSLRHKGLEPA